MSLDNCVHSFFGASKSYADFIVQEYGKNDGLKTVCFRAGCITGPNHSGARLHGFLSYLVKVTLERKKYFIYGYKGKQVRDNIHSADVVSCFWEYFKPYREKRDYLMNHKDYVIKCLEGGANKASSVANEYLSNARSAMGLNYKG